MSSLATSIGSWEVISASGAEPEAVSRNGSSSAYDRDATVANEHRNNVCGSGLFCPLRSNQRTLFQVGFQSLQDFGTCFTSVNCRYMYWSFMGYEFTRMLPHGRHSFYTRSLPNAVRMVIIIGCPNTCKSKNSGNVGPGGWSPAGDASQPHIMSCCDQAVGVGAETGLRTLRLAGSLLVVLSYCCLIVNIRSLACRLKVLTMRAYTFLYLSLLSKICWGTNTTFKWTSLASVIHTPAISSTNHNIGDYVAAGLGMSTSETSSAPMKTTAVDDLEAAGRNPPTDETSLTPTATASDQETQMSESTRSQITSNGTAIITSAASVYGAPGLVHTNTNITNTTTATDCWHSWLDYWSASSVNHITYETELSPLTTVTKTELREDYSPISTSSSWESIVDTYTESSLVTIYSDGYPVSVSVSYDTSTLSRVSWNVVTIRSSLGDFYTTFTTTWTRYSRLTTTRATTALPTPGCKLPALVPECSTQWSSYINGDDWKYYNDFDNSASGYFSGTPDCTQAQITGDWCTSMAGFYFARETMYGQDDDVGWVSANSTSYFPASKSLAPGCSLGCQACSITGESVQLYYWPPSTATLVEDGPVTATLTHFAHNDSSIRTVSIDGE
jgi:hypothetical protein